MELKKSPKADLEKKKGIFLQIGLIVALSLLWGAFEWKSDIDKDSAFAQKQAVDVEEEVIPITTQVKPPPPPPPPPPAMSETFKLVEDDVELEDEFVAVDVEATEETVIDVVIEEEEEVVEEEVFLRVEKMPTFKGGDLNTFRNWVQGRLKYPTIAAENGIQGVVYLEFVVNGKGEVCKIRTLRGVDPLIDKEAERVVKTSPKWSPGEQRGKAVSVKYTLPIKFVLQ